jgi:hypothetical protein
MSKFKTIILLFGLMLNAIVYAQPSDSELIAKVHTVYNPSNIVSLTFGPGRSEKRWEKDGWSYYWYKNYDVKTKTEYPGIYALSYGGVQYRKSGGSYTFDNMLTGGFLEYEGIENPSVSAINAHLKSTYDPYIFYNNAFLGDMLDAPNNIKLADNPDWKWKRYNEVSFLVETTFTRKTNDIGGVEVQKGEFRVSLQRSNDGITYNANDKLLKNGKWLSLTQGSRKKIETVKKYTMSQIEKDTTKTLAQKNIARLAEEFQKSLAVIEIPKFKSANHLMQFTHELLLEGDEDKVTAFMYQMFPRNYFEDWSEIVLNQNGKRMLAEALEDLPNYKKAFCQYPEVKEVGATYVRLYDRNKRRFNRVNVAYKNDRWYITDIGYTIRQEDFSDYESNAETHCDGDPIFIDGEAQFKAGDKVLVLERGTWFNGEILKAEMEKGGYSVKYGRSGLLAWKFVSEVKADPNAVVETENNEDPFIYEIGEKVNVLYTGTWYVGTTLKLSYDKEAYLVDIPDRNIETWTSTENMKKYKAVEKPKDNTTESSTSKPKIKVPKVKIKLR